MLKLSVSSMDTYKTCPKKYHYRYVEKVKVEVKKHTFTEFGSCAHLILELFHQRVSSDNRRKRVRKNNERLLRKRCKGV